MLWLQKAGEEVASAILENCRRAIKTVGYASSVSLRAHGLYLGLKVRLQDLLWKTVLEVLMDAQLRGVSPRAYFKIQGIITRPEKGVIWQ